MHSQFFCPNGYDYYNFRTRTNAFTYAIAVCGFASTTIPIDIKETQNVVKAGLNFKFGPSKPW
jgi:hypothetical protein